jgi:hypothetical protein
MKTVAKKINISQIQLVKILAALVVLLMVTYLYFVQSTAFSAAAYESLTERITETQSEIGELELAFIEKNRSIDRDMASEFSLVVTNDSDTSFTKRTTGTKLTLNE